MCNLKMCVIFECNHFIKKNDERKSRTILWEDDSKTSVLNLMIRSC